MNAYILHVTIAGVPQNHARVFTSREAAEKAGQNLIRRGAAEAAEVVSISVQPILPPKMEPARASA